MNRAISAALVLLILGGCGEQKPAAPKPQPPEVTVAKPIQKTVNVYSEFVGQLDSPQTVELRARVEGYLQQINFKEGAEVKKGDLMFTIDPAQYEVSLQQAKAQLETAQAALQTAQNVKDIEVDKANVERDQATLNNNIQKLKDAEVAYKANAVSREYLDDAATAKKQAEAVLSSAQAILAQAETDYQTRVAQAKASVAGAEAAVAQAQLNLSYTRIYTPLDGRVGLASVKIGAFVGRSDPTLLATVSQTDPVYVNFSASERDVYRIRRARIERGITTIPTEENLPIQMILEDGKPAPQLGKLNFIDRTLDPSTGTLALRAEFPNPEHFLRPGNYARIRIRFYDKPNALLVSERAIGTDQGGKYVLVVNAQNVVERRAVKLAEHDDGFVIVQEGLKPDERIIVNGMQRARPGKPVTPAEEASGSTQAPGSDAAISPEK
jgi:membrane fusion protein (multidrug efflux system)